MSPSEPAPCRPDTPHLVLHLPFPSRSARWRFALVRLEGRPVDALLHLLEAQRATPSTAPIRLGFDATRTSLYHEQVSKDVQDVLVLAALANVETGVPGRLTLPEGILPAGATPALAEVEVHPGGREMCWRFWAHDAVVKSAPATAGLNAYAALWTASPEHEGAALERLARLDASLALDALERGLSLYRIGAERPLGARGSPAAMSALLEHEDAEIRTRALTLLRKAFPAG